ncbi:MAG: TRAP transporter small permease [Oricola sp.]|jgi:TRAP-type C4-dicarboxylate transport system permease small subunit|nr:TRAP transporter small permease [Oricola sp.]
MIRRLNKFIQSFIVALLALMVAVVSWQVLSRYAFSAPSAWTEEVARIILVWLGFLGAAYAHAEKAHLGIDLLEQSLTVKSRQLLAALVNIIGIVFATTVLIVGGGLLVHLTWELRQTTAVLGVPMAYVYAVIPVSGLIISLNSFLFITEGERPA